MSDQRSPEVYAALRAYCERALEVVAANYEEQDDRFREVEWWEEGPDNVFRRIILEHPDAWAPLRNNDEQLTAVPEHETAVKALRDDKTFGGQVDTLVGTVLAVHRVEPAAVTRGLLGKVVRPGFELEDASFDGAYAELEEAFYRNFVPYTAIMPLRGLLIEQSSVGLEEDLELDRLTPDEISACLEFGLLTTPVDRFGDTVMLDSSSRSGIRLRLSLEKTVGDNPIGSGDSKQLHERIDATFEAVVQALRVMKRGDIAPTNRVMFADDWFVKRRSMSPAISPPRDWPGQFSLLGAEHDGLRQLHDAIRHETIQNAGALRLALRRFSMAADRTTSEDKILDTMIAAEALFLSDLDERAELGYRLSLRAAFLLGHDAAERKRVRRFIRDAYGVRSKISHGQEVGVGKLPDGTQVDLPTFADALHQMLRRALVRVIHHVRDTASMIDWDGLVMGSGESTNS